MLVLGRPFPRAVSTEMDTIMLQQTLFFPAPMKVGRSKTANRGSGGSGGGSGSGGGGWIWGPAYTKGDATVTRPPVT